ncbi:MAG: hypothetical protein SF029_24835 [bacterium]|jgi:hypothetical protein|nr:hypothetical protein [bacterium]
MNTGFLLILLVLYTLMMFAFQRTEPKKRRLVGLSLLVIFLFVRDWVLSRDIWPEANVAFAIALFLNLFFWLFIGRYNPVHTSDEIQVLGLDD